MSFYKQQKQNKLLPNKQGTVYELNLGKNNGPFLSKDIMYSNRKSMTLLTNKQILKSHQTMVNTLNNLSKNSNKKQITSVIEQVQNFNSTLQYCQQQISQFHKVSSQLKISQKSLHKQFQELSKNMTLSIQQLFQTSMPGIKLFFKKVKQTNNHDKEQNYQLKKELEKISQDKILLNKGLVECQNKIQVLEKLFNIENKEDRLME